MSHESFMEDRANEDSELWEPEPQDICSRCGATRYEHEELNPDACANFVEPE